MAAVRVLCAGLAVVWAVVGCQPADSGAVRPTEAKRPKVGVSMPAADHGWTAGLGYWAREAVKHYPDVDWIVQDAKNSDDQISALENMKSQGVVAVVVVPFESAAITPIAEKLHAEGVAIVDVSAGFTKPVADTFIEGDNVAFGRYSAELMAHKLGGRGKIAVLEGIPCTVNTDRVQAAKKVFAGYPGIRIVAEDSGMWNREKAEKVMENMLVANPHLDAIWAADDDMALGVESALKAAGRTRGVWILGGGGMKEVVKRVMDRDPLFPGDVTYPPSIIAFGIQVADQMVHGDLRQTRQFFPRHLVINLDQVTPENAQEFYFPDSVY